MTSRIITDPKLVNESVFVSFDFTSNLATGEGILTSAVTASVYSGVDASPSAIVSGAATASGAVVRQLIIAGVLGVIYKLICLVTTSSGQTLELTTFLAVIPDVP